MPDMLLYLIIVVITFPIFAYLYVSEKPILGLCGYLKRKRLDKYFFNYPLQIKNSNKLILTSEILVNYIKIDKEPEKKKPIRKLILDREEKKDEKDE